MLATREPRWLLPGLMAAALPLFAQPLDVFDHVPEAYLGAGVCGSCHAEQFASQSASGHALSLARVADHRLAALFVPAGSLARAGGAEYSYRTDHTGLHVEVAVGGEQLGLRLEWAFGAGEQAVTFVGHPDKGPLCRAPLQLLRANRITGDDAGTSRRASSWPRGRPRCVLPDVWPRARHHALLPMPLHRAAGAR